MINLHNGYSNIIPLQTCAKIAFQLDEDNEWDDNDEYNFTHIKNISSSHENAIRYDEYKSKNNCIHRHFGSQKTEND